MRDLYTTIEPPHFFSTDLYIAPTNAQYNGNDIDFLPKDENEVDKYHPSMESHPAANWFDSDTKRLWLIVKGREPIDIVTTPVIQVNTRCSGVQI